MIKDKEGVTIYFSRIKMTDEEKLKKREKKVRQVLINSID